MTSKITKARTVTPKNQVIQERMTPDSELELIVGGAYTKNGVEHKYGHTALRVKTPSVEHVYDFGRYGAIYPESLGFGIELTGSDSPRGEGILNIWTSAAVYIATENLLGRTSWGYSYSIFEVQAMRSISFFKRMVKGLEPRKSTAHFKRYKISQDYFALGPNCTTLSLDGAREAIPKIADNSREHVRPGDVLDLGVVMAMRAKYGVPDHLFLPANLKSYLESDDVRIRIDKKNTYK